MNNWIKVEDDLPNFGDRILQYQDLGKTFNYLYVVWNESELEWYKFNKITHWQLAPPPPTTQLDSDNLDDSWIN